MSNPCEEAYRRWEEMPGEDQDKTDLPSFMWDAALEWAAIRVLETRAVPETENNWWFHERAKLADLIREGKTS